MAGVDFRRAADLFMGTEKDLAQALGIKPDEVAEYRDHPGRAPDDLMESVGKVLMERGRGMMRVGELLVEESGGG